MKVAIFHDETEVHLNPKIGFAWMRQGDQKLLATPGQNQKAVLSGGVNWRSGKLLMVRGVQKVTEVFVKFLEHARTRLRCYHKIHVTVDQDSSHTSGEITQYLQRWEHRIQMHLLPSWSPDANPMNLSGWCCIILSPVIMERVTWRSYWCILRSSCRTSNHSH